MRKVQGTTTSTRRHLPAAMRYLGACSRDEPLDVTVVLRRRQPMGRPIPRTQRADFATRYGADPADVERMRAFGAKHGLQELACDMACRTLHWRGNAAALQQAFGVKLGRYEIAPGGASFVGSAQEPVLPDPAVIAVLGLDRRPVAHPHFRIAQAQPAATYTPVQIGQLYAFPAGDGTGQTIAIIELGGGYSQADLDTYFSGLGLKTPQVTAVSVDGGSNQPGSSADAEVMLDIEVAGALAPAATFAVYFAPNTDQGFYDAITQAAQGSSPPAMVMSISWGGPEDSWSAASRNAMETALEDAAALGVTVCVAAGDGGSGDGESDGQPHVDYPAASPSVLACGGTRLMSSGGAIASEVVWNETAAGEGATGGGVSQVFALPTWQASAGIPAAPNGFAGRGVPDVAGNADPLTGYEILVDGQSEVVGGTSAVAPLWAGLVARLNQQLGKSLGLANAALYGTGGNGFRDIIQGDNGAYAAGPGWDACTGWGSPNGTALLAALSGTGSGSPAPVRHRKPPKPGKPKPKKPKPKPKKPKPGSSGRKRR
ncbi:MAG: S8 family serine peptidase [Xanthomonadaceae bacterium]|nr:S8 family serine peptidase [Xanthomonadaceae bacterium]